MNVPGNIARSPRALVVLSFFAMALFALSCASQRPPEGGPADSEPPEIIETEPESGTTNFDGQEVTLEFSEYVNRQSFQESVHISPLLETQPTYDWSGKSVTIIFPDTLAENRTYVITVGSKVKDVNAGNAMASSFNLAFSTGDSLDEGRFSGKVFDDEPSGISLFAYLLGEGRGDTLDPSLHKPDYALQTGQDGSFRFSNISEGMYRVFAVRDNQNNFIYDIESDEIGVPQADVYVGDSLVRPKLRYLLSKEDTTAPYIQSIAAIHERMIQVKFSEDIFPVPFPLERVSVIDSAEGKTITPLSWYDSPTSRFAYNLYLSDALRGDSLAFFADSLSDSFGNIMPSTEGGFAFVGSEIADTARPVLTGIFPSEGSKDVPVDSTFFILLDRPFQPGISIELRDSSDNDIPLTILQTRANLLRLAHAPLAPEMAYELCIDLLSVRGSVQDRAVADTVYCFAFTTAAGTGFGSLSGQVVDDDSSGNASYVRIRDAAEKLPTVKEKTGVNGKFSFPESPAGRFIVDGFVDEDSTTTWSPGEAAPFKPAERFGIYTDSVRVRARWETKDVIFHIPSRPK